LKLSEDKISHLSHVLTDAGEAQGTLKFPDKVKARNVLKDILTRYCKLEDEIDDTVRKKLASYSKNYMEGSREWDVLYRKHFEEEMKKRWR
jgi:hypothetical protein